MLVEEVSLFKLNCSSLIRVVFCDGLGKLSGLRESAVEFKARESESCPWSRKSAK